MFEFLAHCDLGATRYSRNFGAPNVQGNLVRMLVSIHH